MCPLSTKSKTQFFDISKKNRIFRGNFEDFLVLLGGYPSSSKGAFYRICTMFRYGLSVVVNVGWCPSKDEKRWIKKGDYLTTTQFTIRMSKDVDEYKQNVDLECYCMNYITPFYTFFLTSNLT